MNPARLAVAIDPITRRIIPSSLVIEPSGAIEIRLPFRLESPNKILHAHWRTRQDEKKAWQARLLNAIATAVNRMSLADCVPPIRALGLAPAVDRRRVVIERLVPSRRNFIADDDNLAYCSKFLVDQLKRMGFVRDDSRKWVDRETRQSVSPDGHDWTVIRVEPFAPTDTPAPGERRKT